VISASKGAYLTSKFADQLRGFEPLTSASGVHRFWSGLNGIIGADSRLFKQIQ